MTHKTGMTAKVEIWNSQIKESEFFNCTVTGTVTALDRDYRVNVQLSNGKEIRECAPECVVIATDQLNTVKVIFKDSAYNYTTNVSAQSTEESAREYFVGKSFDMGIFPKEDFQTCIGIEFTNNNL